MAAPPLFPCPLNPCSATFIVFFACTFFFSPTRCERQPGNPRQWAMTFAKERVVEFFFFFFFLIVVNS
ncbi:hypothetical protein V8C37DRAFT_375284 [Trichoderma ceciliae]